MKMKKLASELSGAAARTGNFKKIEDNKQIGNDQKRY